MTTLTIDSEPAFPLPALNSVKPVKSRKKAAKAPKPNIHSHAGIAPFEFKVVVLPNKVNEKSRGGVIIPDVVQGQQQQAVSKGTIVAVSPFAFTYFDPDVKTYRQVLAKWPGTPKIGDQVLFARYSGSELRGNDWETYRIMNDKDVMAILDEATASMEREYE